MGRRDILGGRYRLEGTLGSGGMGTVYLAHDLALDRAVAVKVLHPQFAHDPVFLSRFLREARLAARVSDHPNIVVTYDVGRDSIGPYIVMERVSGETLRQRLDRVGGLSIAEALAITRELAAALDYAHSRGLVHRDIKPQNVLLPDKGAKLADFGIAAGAETTHLTLPGTIIGSAHYMAPERLRGEPGDAASDMYSLGVLLFEMLSGRTPFAGDTPAVVAAQHVLAEAPPIESLRTDVPANVAALIAAMLRKEPQERIETPRMLLEALSVDADSRDESTIPTQGLAGHVPLHEHIDDPLERRGMRGRIAAAILLFGALAAIVTGTLQAGSGDPLQIRRPIVHPDPSATERPRPAATVAPTPSPSPTPTPTATARFAPTVAPAPVIPPPAPGPPGHDGNKPGKGPHGHDSNGNGNNGHGDKGHGGHGGDG